MSEESKPSYGGTFLFMFTIFLMTALGALLVIELKEKLDSFDHSKCTHNNGVHGRWFYVVTKNYINGSAERAKAIFIPGDRGLDENAIKEIQRCGPNDEEGVIISAFEISSHSLMTNKICTPTP